jgi:sulfite reductase (NADPH) flavoprotein alpha-component
MLSTLRIENSPFNEQQIKQLQHTIGGLNPAQSQWLSGYLAGRLADPLQDVQQPQRAVEVVLTVVYATETGNSEGIATQLVTSLEQQGIRSDLKSMGDLRPAALRKLKNVVFIISTHGEGDPPDEALELFEYLESERASRLPELNYRILALGDRSYHKFCEAGRVLDQRLQELGARAWGKRVECDVNYANDATAYTDEVIRYALDELTDGEPSEKSNTLTTNHLSLVPTESRWNRANPYSAEVGQIQKITGVDSGKDIYHIELSLDDAGLNYEAGDALGVWAPNDSELVGGILAALEIGPSEIVNFNEQDITISKVMTDHLEITRLSVDTVFAYANAAQQKDLEDFYSGLEADQQQAFIAQRQFADLVDEYPARLPAQTLVELLRPLAPRSYSIASSQKAVDEEVHLTVATLTSNATGTKRQGVASGFLNQRLRTGDQLGVFLEPNKRFRLPEDPETPIIMIAAGTGIAPYRAFMQELEDRESSPDSWLIFGNPHLRTDFLYQREWLGWRESGLLNRIDTAWSRDQAEKHYVQDVVGEQIASIDEWLQRGACIYLCGSLQMGHEVLETLQHALASHRDIDTDLAAALVADLRRQRRIKKDLY